jgi:hypothetical protein
MQMEAAQSMTKLQIAFLIQVSLHQPIGIEDIRH